MTKKDVMELKKRFTKNDCTFTRMCGCYVNAHGEKVVQIGETFLNLEDEEFYKYLEIAKKTLSGSIGNNLLSLNFPTQEEAVGGKQHFLMALRESRLKNEDLLDRFYDLIIEHYSYVGNYLILIFHDAYDVVTKTTDNYKVDESEEVYQYLLCAICPVCLSKPALGYREDENRIGARIRDWVVGAPDIGFTFPAFSDRSSDIHSITYFVKDAKDSHSEFVDGALGCGHKRTATEQKQTFHAIVKHALGPDTDKKDPIFMEIQEQLNTVLEEQINEDITGNETILLTSTIVTDVLLESGIPEGTALEIQEIFEEEFGNEPPTIKNLIDEKALETATKAKREKVLEQQVEHLQKELISKSLSSDYCDEDASNSGVKTYDVVLRVKPEKATQIKSQVISGQKYLIIPMEEHEHVNVNGMNTKV